MKIKDIQQECKLNFFRCLCGSTIDNPQKVILIGVLLPRFDQKISTKIWCNLCSDWHYNFVKIYEECACCCNKKYEFFYFNGEKYVCIDCLKSKVYQLYKFHDKK